MEIKAIALDMDGTLLDPSGSIDDKLLSLLSNLRKQGIKIFVATGRTQKEIADVLPSHVKLDGYVTANGMGAYTDSKPLAQHALHKQLLQQVLSEAREAKLYYEVHPLQESRFALELDKEYFTNEVIHTMAPETLLTNEFNSRTAAIDKKIQWVQELNFQDIVKVYFFSMSPKKINDWKARLNTFKQERDFSMSSSSLHNVEIMVSNVSKATGIELLLKEYGLIKDNLLVVGDGENDIPMFQLAAHAVAMKNAEENVKSEANEITSLTYEQNGLFYYLLSRFD
ncbi:HAD family hydrolase [Ornithinibacillus xuwenensis]|uniref:HAD family hydrolase n=1 Tax=Ornithinibacillus xuwenensis TaxID=3144668 RepID=A0ABU9XN38_9BACI